MNLAHFSVTKALNSTLEPHKNLRMTDQERECLDLVCLERSQFQPPLRLGQT